MFRGRACGASAAARGNRLPPGNRVRWGSLRAGARVGGVGARLPSPRQEDGARPRRLGDPGSPQAFRQAGQWRPEDACPSPGKQSCGSPPQHVSLRSASLPPQAKNQTCILSVEAADSKSNWTLGPLCKTQPEHGGKWGR